jgi:hypothetical protein
VAAVEPLVDLVLVVLQPQADLVAEPILQALTAPTQVPLAQPIKDSKVVMPPKATAAMPTVMVAAVAVVQMPQVATDLAATLFQALAVQV